MTTRKKLKAAAFYVGISALLALVLLPIFFLVLTSVKSPKDFYGKNVFALPERIAWTNFYDALFKGRLSRYMLNGLLISAVKVPLGIFLEALAAFAITRLRVWRPNVIFIVFLIGMMIPMQVTLVPLNIGFQATGLSNTYLG
jgi:raffinose/stachyose/melibiose transport system permease protein